MRADGRTDVHEKFNGNFSKALNKNPLRVQCFLFVECQTQYRMRGLLFVY